MPVIISWYYGFLESCMVRLLLLRLLNLAGKLCQSFLVHLYYFTVTLRCFCWVSSNQTIQLIAELRCCPRIREVLIEVLIVSFVWSFYAVIYTFTQQPPYLSLGKWLSSRAPLLIPYNVLCKYYVDDCCKTDYIYIWSFIVDLFKVLRIS